MRFAIDDFGTGYSSLTYLKRLPLDRLKIDRSFVADLDGEASGRMLVQTILMIARNLGLECVAEGIEHDSQLVLLREQDCALGQGLSVRQTDGRGRVSRLDAVAPALRWPTSSGC